MSLIEMTLKAYLVSAIGNSMQHQYQGLSVSFGSILIGCTKLP